MEPLQSSAEGKQNKVKETLPDDHLPTLKKKKKKNTTEVLSLYLSAGGSSTTLMGQIDEGIGFIGHYLEGQQEPHTGALQFAGHLV